MSVLGSITSRCSGKEPALLLRTEGTRESGGNRVYVSFCFYNTRALIGQSAVVYCASKPMAKIARLLNYYIKAIDHKFLWVIARDHDLREHIPHTWASFNDNLFQSNFSA